MFQSLSDKLSAAFKHFRNKGKLTEADVKVGMREIKLALLEADVNFKVVREFVKQVTERAVGSEVLESLVPAQQIVKIVNEELTAIMGGSQAKLTISSTPPTVVMMCGLQGAGKTTHAAKLAAMYKKQGKRPLLVACDIYRPAAIKQLQILGEQINVPVFTMGTDVSPVKIAEEGLKYAKDNFCDMVFIDTAGRLHIDTLHTARVVDDENDVQLLSGDSLAEVKSFVGSFCVAHYLISPIVVSLNLILSPLTIGITPPAAIVLSLPFASLMRISPPTLTRSPHKAGFFLLAITAPTSSL